MARSGRVDELMDSMVVPAPEYTPAVCGYCRDCEHWDDPLAGRGICGRIRDEVVARNSGGDEPATTSAFGTDLSCLSVRADFGCVLFTPRGVE